jgi:integrase/recombinase XerD
MITNYEYLRGIDNSIQLDEVKEQFVHHFMQGIMGIVSDNQAQRIEKVLIHELGKVEVVDPYRTYDQYRENDFEQLVDLFIKAKRVNGLSSQTLQMYQQSLEHLMKLTGLTCITDYTSEVIRKFLETKINETSTTTADNYRRVFSSFFGWCHKNEHILRDPMYRIENIKQPKKVKKPFSNVELDKLRNTIKKRMNNASKDKNSRQYFLALRGLVILELLVSSGVRVSELKGIRLKNINLDERSVKVLGKGNKERITYFSKTAKYYLQKYITLRGQKEADDDYLLIHNTGKQLGSYGVERFLRELGADAGVANVHPHRFRRTFATNLVNHGMGIERVQKLMGHESINTTRLYVLSNENTLKTEYNLIQGE